MAIRTIGIGATTAQLQEVKAKIKPAVDVFKVLAPMGVGTKERDGIRQMLQRQTALLVNEGRACDHHKQVRAGRLGAKDKDSLMRSLIAVGFDPEASALQETPPEPGGRAEPWAAPGPSEPPVS